MPLSSEYGGRAYLGVTSELPLEAIVKHFGIEGDEGSFSIGVPRRRAPSTVSKSSIIKSLNDQSLKFIVDPFKK